jgi:phosphate transport system protein
VIDEHAVLLLSKAPLATQLRLIISVTKIARDLERIGDEATTIARRAIELGQEPQLKPYIDIPRMSQMAMTMLNDALQAFATGDSAKALAVIPRDREVDGLNKQLYRELASFMIERPSTITRCLNLMAVSKALERIADHAKTSPRTRCIFTKPRTSATPARRPSAIARDYPGLRNSSAARSAKRSPVRVR